MEELEKVNLRYRLIYSLLHILSAIDVVLFIIAPSLINISIALLIIIVYVITYILHEGRKDYIENKNKFL